LKTGRILGHESTGINQLLPHVNEWAWDIYLQSLSNRWLPTDIPMQDDIKQWKDKSCFSDDERLVIKRCLGFFAGAESLVGNNLLLGIFRHVTDPECRQYIINQTFEESIHNLTIVYICDSLNLNPKEIYEAHLSIPSIQRKDNFLIQITKDSLDIPFYNANIAYDRQRVLRNLITYYIICEGIFFYTGFATLLNFGRQNKLKGIAQQIAYSYRDEFRHLEFGTALINKIIEQDPELWRDRFVEDTISHIRQATEIEVDYARDILPRGILGLNAEMCKDYVEYLANRRLDSLGLKPLFPYRVSPFPWMSEVIELPKVDNFFEKNVIEYRSGIIDDFE
jgi:ribonucleoside-diphosphate reductase beta chain